MHETEISLNEKLLKLQNALICQCVDQVKWKNDVDSLSERADFYESLYNKTKTELYALEIKYSNIVRKYEELDKECLRNLGSVALIKIVLKRLKNKIIGG